MSNQDDYYFDIIEASQKYARQADPIYQPTSFWDLWTYKLSEDLKNFGFARFKEAPSCLSLFVSHYGAPFNEIPDELRQEFLEFASEKGMAPKQVQFLDFYLSGQMNAFSDYRVLKAAGLGNVGSIDLASFSEGSIGSPQEQFEFDGKTFSRNSLNYMHQLVFLRDCIGDFVPNTFLEIGGGWGSLGEVLIKGGNAQTRYINVDISPSNCISEYYLKSTFEQLDLFGFEKSITASEIDVQGLPQLSVIPSWCIEKLHGKIDVFINAISFQEMEPDVVRNYIDKVSTLAPKFVLIRNLREGKNKSVQSDSQTHVVEPVERDFYINCYADNNYRLINENVVPFGRKTVDGFHSEILVFEKS